MSLFANLGHWIRTRADALTDLQHPTAWLSDAWNRLQAPSVIPMNPQMALTLSTYYDCLRCISEDVGKLPLFIYKRLPRGKAIATDHPLYGHLHDCPNDDMTAMTFRETITHHALGWGNGYALIYYEPDATDPDALYPIHPTRVRPRRGPENQLQYLVRLGDSLQGSQHQDWVLIEQEHMLHIRGLSAEGTLGYSVAQLAAQSLGLSISAETFGAAFFENGTQLGGVLEHPKSLSDKAMVHLRESFESMHRGSNRAWKPAILEEGMQWKGVGIPPQDAQFLETRQFQVLEIARWFRMPPHKIGALENAHYANIEQQNLEYVADTLMPWLVRWEQELKRKLFADDPEYFAEHDVRGLLRGDHTTRATYYRTMFDVGALSPNDIRELENQNPVGPEGDTYFVAANNLQPLKLVANGTPPPPIAATEPQDFTPAPVGRNGTRNGQHATTTTMGG